MAAVARVVGMVVMVAERVAAVRGAVVGRAGLGSHAQVPARFKIR